MAAPDPATIATRLKSSKRLPSPPGTAVRVLELCRDEASGTKEITDAIGSDPSLAARLLKFANSPATGVNREVSSLRDAVLLMGARSVKLVALGFSLTTEGPRAACEGFDLEEYWRESSAAAAVARAAARQYFKADPECAYTATLLARIGRLAMAQGLPEEYAHALTAARKGQPLLLAETERFGMDHAAFGADLLADWNLPAVFVDAVRRQYQPESAVGAGAGLTKVIGAAYALAPIIVEESPTEEQVAVARRIVRTELRLDDAAWARLAGEVKTAYRATAQLLNVDLSRESIIDLHAEAQEAAARVGIVSQLERSKESTTVAGQPAHSSKDALTGAATRFEFDQRIAAMGNDLEQGQGHFAVVMFDLDNLKGYNDTLGRRAGDLVLARIARAVQNSLRPEDLLARYGEDEFAILFPATPREAACLAAAKIRQTVGALRVKIGDQTLTVTVSLGVCVSSDIEGVATGEAVASCAAEQMELSKSRGRNTWSYRGKTAAKVASRAA